MTAGGFAAVARAAVDLDERFFADCGIGILHSVYGGVAPQHRSPTTANKPAGQDSWALMRPGLDDSTAPIADECQSFLDKLLSSGANERRMIDGARYSVGDPQSVGVALSRRKQGFESPR